MKKLILRSVVLFFVSLLLLTSCIDGRGNISQGQAFGIVRVVRDDNDSVKIKLLDVTVSDIPFYSIRFKEANDDNCFFVSYEYNEDLEANSIKNVEACGYLTVDIYDKIDVDKWLVSSVLSDTSKVLTDEAPLVEVLWNGDFAYLKGKIFLISTLQMSSDQKMNWDLSYDIDNMSSEEYGRRYYNVFLRSTIRTQSTYSKEKISVANAFEMKDYMETIAKKEKELGASAFKIRFNYLAEINENGQMKWDYQDTKDIPVVRILSEQ